MQLRKRLFMISGGTYGRLGNAYAIQHDRGYVLIDCSVPAAQETIRKNLHYWGSPKTKSHTFFSLMAMTIMQAARLIFSLKAQKFASVQPTPIC